MKQSLFLIYFSGLRLSGNSGFVRRLRWGKSLNRGDRGEKGTAGGEVRKFWSRGDKLAFSVDIPYFTKWHLIFRDFSLNNTMNPKGGVDG